MELRNIITFIKVTELQSFSKAALALGYSQSNITMQIKQLEQDLNCALFNRIGKKISLTEQGSEFLTYANSISHLIENAKSALSTQSEPCGILTIGILESLCSSYLPQLIYTFYNKYPKVNTIIKIGTFEELAAMLNQNIIDILWTYDDPISNQNWTKALEFQSEIQVIAAKNHPLLQHQKKASFSHLENSTFIFTEVNCSYRRHFERALQSAGISYHVFLEIGNTEIIKKFVESGLCLSILPVFSFQKELELDSLAVIPMSDFSLSMDSQIFFHKDKLPTSAMLAFLDQVKTLL